MLKKKEEVKGNMFDHCDISQMIDGLTLLSPPQRRVRLSPPSHHYHHTPQPLSPLKHHHWHHPSPRHHMNPAQPPPPPTAPVHYNQPPASRFRDCSTALIYIDGCTRDPITSYFDEEKISVGSVCSRTISEISDDCFREAFMQFESPHFTRTETDVASSSYTGGTLGLTLSKTASFECLLEASLHKENQAQPLLEKLKASNFPINSLKIGYWQRISTNDGHLTAKLYYAKQKLVWEVLEGPLKRKMEIHWSDITGINAVMPENQPSTLRIELDKPPLFFKETDPQPRKHTIWQQADDFTDGNATTWRIHCLRFPPGVLNTHYEKLLQCYKELVDLSRKPFPSHEISIFSSAAMYLPISNIHFNPNGFQPQPQEQSTYFTTPTANLHCMIARARNHQQRFEGTVNNYPVINVDQGRLSMFTSEVMSFDEIAPLTQDHSSAFSNPDNRQMMMDYQMNDCAMLMGGYVSSVQQHHNGLPHNDMAKEMDNFITPPFVSSDNLTAIANLLSDQHLLPDNHTTYGTPFQNPRNLLPDNGLTTPVNPYVYQNQYDFPGNLMAPVDRLLYQNQHGFPDNLSRGNPHRK